MKDIISIAVPKGKLMKPSVSLLSRVGIKGIGISGDSRRLIFNDRKNHYRLMIVRAIDVPTYVEYGAADMGIAGKELILEQDKDLYEPLDLGFGYCKIIVAGPKNSNYPCSGSPKLKVATKYPNIAEDYFSRKGIPVEIIKLYGSIELAPLTGLADLIVDLSSSGRTLAENNLVILDVIAESTARLIVNRASIKIKYKRITEIIRKLEDQIKG